MIFAALFVFGIAGVFPQDDGYIPEELLRPRREEALRYPIDTVIGVLGQGSAAPEAYAFARRTAAALLAGDMDTSVLSTVNRSFLENCMNKLQEITPRYFRLGGGRTEPDGAVSFLIRFVGREQGITGELFIRFAELRRPPPPPPPEPEPVVSEDAADADSGDGNSENIETESAETEAIADEAIRDETVAAEDESAGQEITAAQIPLISPPPVERIWVFEDVILEESRSREVENAESRHRFDFPPYERFF